MSREEYGTAIDRAIAVLEGRDETLVAELTKRRDMLAEDLRFEDSSERWTVDSVDEVVEVPAGKFHAIVLQKAGGDTLKTYWFVPGIGKVKETGGQTEALVSYSVVK